MFKRRWMYRRIIYFNTEGYRCTTYVPFWKLRWHPKDFDHIARYPNGKRPKQSQLHLLFKRGGK